jgi:hypothetical protein
METSSRTTFTDKVSIVGLMAVSTTVNGSTTRWRAKAPLLGVTEGDMKVTTRMIRSTDMEPSNGLMAESTSVTGAKVSNTEKVSTSKRAKRDKVSGRWARELSGSRMPAALQINDLS